MVPTAFFDLSLQPNARPLGPSIGNVSDKSIALLQKMKCYRKCYKAIGSHGPERGRKGNLVLVPDCIFRQLFYVGHVPSSL